MLVPRQFCHLDGKTKPDLLNEYIDPVLDSLPLSWRKIFLKDELDDFQDLVKLLL